MAEEHVETGAESAGDDPLVMRVMTSLTLAAVIMLVALGGWAWVHRPRSAPDLTTGGPGAQVFQQQGSPADQGAEQAEPTDPSAMNRDQKARRLFGGMNGD